MIEEDNRSDSSEVFESSVQIAVPQRQPRPGNQTSTGLPGPQILPYVSYKATVHGRTAAIRVRITKWRKATRNGEKPLRIKQNLVLLSWISAIIPAAKFIAVSTGPLLTMLARLLNTIRYRGPKGKLETKPGCEGRRGLRTAYVRHYTTPEVH
jgi:hypothetical protein